jgi:hypothetical protein
MGFSRSLRAATLSLQVYRLAGGTKQKLSLSELHGTAIALLTVTESLFRGSVSTKCSGARSKEYRYANKHKDSK